ncbi:MAG: hypothetical protein LBE86_10540 [Gemmobacter sp.]|jgi:hypothetical protein|nr:hypothetical protein [Gemmobacter sp.]
MREVKMVTEFMGGDIGNGPDHRPAGIRTALCKLPYRRWIALGSDGWLYHLTHDGSDGAAWGNYNAGDNTRARCIPADPGLISAIEEGSK